MDPVAVGFLLGAPFWGGAGVAVFALLTWAADRRTPHDSETEAVEAEATYLTERLVSRIRARKDADVVDLDEYRGRRGGAA
jgi:hypothetical protein